MSSPPTHNSSSRYVAAKVPDKPNEFVGALHIPGVQLLIIWAQYQQPSLLMDMIGKRNYQGVYTDLNSASYTIAASRVLLEDHGGGRAQVDGHAHGDVGAAEVSSPIL